MEKQDGVPALSEHCPRLAKLGEHVSIQSLTPPYTQALASMLQSAVASFQDGGPVIASILKRTRSLDQEYFREDSDYLILVSNTGALLGGAGIAPLAALPASEGYCELRDLFVIESERGRGLARSLLYECLKKADSLGYKRIYLETTPDMMDAQKLFKRFGFRPVQHSGEPRVIRNQSLACYFMLDDLEVDLIDPVQGLKRRKAPTS